MSYTISFQVSKKANQAHNRREEKSVSRANERDKENGFDPHIKENSDYKTFVDMLPMEGCHEILDEAVRSYNAKQKRKDRKTTVEKEVSKYETSSKQTILVREVILTIGNKNEHPEDDECRRILQRQYKVFQQKNPNLKIIGAYYHNDEPGAAPHMHIDFIPFHKKRERGLDIQLGMKGALEDMGYENKGFSTKEERDAGAMSQWSKEMHETMHEIARDYGLETVKGVSGKKKHEETNVYKKQELKQEISTLQLVYEGLNDRIEELKKQKKEAERSKEEAEVKVANLENRINKNEEVLEDQRTRIEGLSKERQHIANECIQISCRIEADKDYKKFILEREKEYYPKDFVPDIDLEDDYER